MRLPLSATLALLLGASAVGAAPIAYTVNSDAAEQPDRLLRLDLASGSSTVVASFATGGSVSFGDIEGLSFDANGTLVAVDDDTKTLLSINPQTGATSFYARAQVGNTRLPSAPLDPSIAFTCSNELVLVGGLNRSLYRVNPASAQADLVGSLGSLEAEITDIAASRDGLYGLGVDGLYRINVATAKAVLIGPYGGGVNFSLGGGLAFAPDGGLWAVADRGPTAASAIYRIDPATGTAFQVGLGPPGLESLAIGPAPCAPEGTPAVAVPVLSGLASALLGVLVLLAGVLGIGFSRR